MIKVTLTQKQAREVFDRLRSAWWSGECTADLDDAMARLNEQLDPPPYPTHERRPAEYRHPLDPEDREAFAAMQGKREQRGIGTIHMFGGTASIHKQQEADHG